MKIDGIKVKNVNFVDVFEEDVDDYLISDGVSLA
jgi:hypothetical protein